MMIENEKEVGPFPAEKVRTQGIRIKRITKTATNSITNCVSRSLAIHPFPS